MKTDLLFMGRKTVSARILRQLHKNPAINIVGVLTDNHLQGSPTAEVANELNLRLYSFEEALLEMSMRRLNFDLGISILYWRKLKDEFLKLPKKGIINFHPAILPEYKGTGGYNLAILEALQTWGVTAHYVDENIDTGEIIRISEFDIDPNRETVVSLESKSMNVLENLAIDIINEAISCQKRLPSYPNEGGRYVSRDDMERMKKIEEGDDLPRKVRAFWFPPYDGAYIEIDGEKYTLINSEILKSLAPKGTTNLFADSAEC